MKRLVDWFRNRDWAIWEIVGVLLVILLLAAWVQTCQQVRQVEASVDKDLERAIEKVVSPYYAEAVRREETWIRIRDSIDNEHKKAHYRIDSMRVAELQRAIDSLYNGR